MSFNQDDKQTSTQDHDQSLLDRMNHLETLIESIIYQLTNTTTNFKELNVYTIIINVMEIVEKLEAVKLQGYSKQKIVCAVISRLANGLDNVQGTKDDLISPSARDALVTLVQNKLVDSFITSVIKATKGVFNINKTKGWCCFK